MPHTCHIFPKRLAHIVATLALIVSAILVGGGVPVAVFANTVITFDTLPIGTQVTSQYYAQGVDFVVGGSYGGEYPAIVSVPAGQAQSGNYVADISQSGEEFAVPIVTGLLTTTARTVSVYVGKFDDGTPSATVYLRAYDASNRLLTTSG